MRRLLMLLAMLMIVAVGVRTQPPTSTQGQLNGWAWASFSNAEKMMYLDGVAAGIQQGIENVTYACADCVTPTAPAWLTNRTDDAIHAVDEFYRVEANRYWPIASVYVQTRRALRPTVAPTVSPNVRRSWGAAPH